MRSQPVGEPVQFTGASRPARTELHGRHVLLRPLDPQRDARSLYEVSHAPTGDPSVWTYLYEGPFESFEAFRAALFEQSSSDDPLFFTISDPKAVRALGIVSYLAIVPEHGTIEIGNIWFSPELQRTTAATEAIHLLSAHAFDALGYRRLEWKCNALNTPSRRAAQRFGFVFEGVFAQHRVVKGRNRDTAWYSITDRRWPAVRAAQAQWLASENFDADGRQRRSLGSLTEPGPDPAEQILRT